MNVGGGETLTKSARQDELARWLCALHPEWADDDEVNVAEIARRLGYAEISVRHWPSRRLPTYTGPFPTPARRDPVSHEAWYVWGDIRVWYATGTRRRRPPGPRMNTDRWVTLVRIHDGDVHELPRPKPLPGKWKRPDILPPISDGVARHVVTALINRGLVTRTAGGVFRLTREGRDLVQGDPVWVAWARARYTGTAGEA